MELSKALEELEDIKKQYSEIASKYPPIVYGGDCTVYFGSRMWKEEFECYMTPQDKLNILMNAGVTEIKVKHDHMECIELIRKADKIMEACNLSQFLIDGGILCWIGALPEPYMSAY